MIREGQRVSLSITTRRWRAWISAVLGIATVALVAAGCATATAADGTSSARPVVLDEELKALETEYDARVGVYAIDTGSGDSVAYRADERFAYTSSFKALLAAAILQQVPDLDQMATYTAADLVSHSPVTELHVDTGMSVRDLAEATVRTSDNTAANLLLDQLGGPAGFAAILAAAGDTTTQPVRYETELNTAVPGDPRDTSTPRALTESLRGFAVDGKLPAPQGDTLVEWMSGNATGDELIRAGAPTGWVVADKSGAGDYGTRNDIGIVWPPGGSPVVIAVLTTHDTPDATRDDTLVAKAAAAALAGFDR